MRYTKPLLSFFSIVIFLLGFFISPFENDFLFTVSAITFAFLLVGLDFKIITGNFQIVLIFIYAISLGIYMDVNLNEFGFYTIIFITVAIMTVLRQIFMPLMTYIRWIWVEPLFLGFATFLLFFYGILTEDLLSINVFNVSFLTFLPAFALVFGYVQDSFKIKNKVKFGYKVKIGQKAPDFSLKNQYGQVFNLEENLGGMNLMLIFVRGDWCPGCHIMLRTYNKYAEKFKEKNVFVVAIGPDDIDVNKTMVEKLGIGYQLLSDDLQKVSSQYGVVYNNPVLEKAQANYEEGIPLPASFLLDKKGIVKFVSRPERVGEFLSPNLIAEVLDDLEK